MCIRDRTLTGGPAVVTVQTTDTIANPCTGVGTKVSIAEGDFFAINRFVFAKTQSMILSKYTNKATETNTGTTKLNILDQRLYGISKITIGN